MKGGPSEPPYRRRLQTTLRCCFLRDVVVLCHEDARASCCTKDEGERPFGVALYEEASNCHKLLRAKNSLVVNVMVKRRDFDHVMWGLER